VTPDIEALQKELAAAKAEIQSLRLRLNNVTYILSEEMTASGRLPKLEFRPSTIEVGTK
jgi:hypothetical protein